MQWQEESIILGSKIFSETSRIITLFNRSIGKTAGLLKSIKTPVHKGDVSDVLWKGRMPEHLGLLKIENMFSPFPYAMSNPIAISIIDSACTLCVNGIPERAPHVNLFDNLKKLLMSVNSDFFLANYALFELQFLSDVGIGLDWSKCAVTGKEEGLYFVSPRTGRAVTYEVGEQYKERLFVLPEFFIRSDVIPTIKDIFYALKITEHFLKIFFCGINNKELPLSRNNIVEIITTNIEESKL